MPTPSFSSSLSPSGSEEGAADAAPPAPTLISEKSAQKERKSSGSPLSRRGVGGEAKRPAAPPVLSEVQAYAAEQYLASSEAQTEAAAFHDHFQSNGWRVGGKTPMVDWQAAFRGWMRRRANFQLAPAAPNATPSRARTSPKPPDPNRWR